VVQPATRRMQAQRPPALMVCSRERRAFGRRCSGGASFRFFQLAFGFPDVAVDDVRELHAVLFVKSTGLTEFFSLRANQAFAVCFRSNVWDSRWTILSLRLSRICAR